LHDEFSGSLAQRSLSVFQWSQENYGYLVSIIKLSYLPSSFFSSSRSIIWAFESSAIFRSRSLRPRMKDERYWVGNQQFESALPNFEVVHAEPWFASEVPSGGLPRLTWCSPRLLLSARWPSARRWKWRLFGQNSTDPYGFLSQLTTYQSALSIKLFDRLRCLLWR
jgi:hypothetical protein